MSEVIKTTAQFQEANEPIKQRPVIQIERPLPNTIRASIDSGRDNPFRPDGAIYKSADPIVDYYKYGQNQSRANSPTDIRLLLDTKAAKKKDKMTEKRRKMEANAEASASAAAGGGKVRKSCWRRWLCCCFCDCCFRCCRGRKDDDADHADSALKLGQQEPVEGNNIEIRLDNTDANTQQIIGLSSNPSKGTVTKDSKQTKIVVLRDNNDSHSLVNGSETKTQSLVSVETKNEYKSPTPTTDTQVKRLAKSSRCVIS